jgi:siderophore synthetase component
MSMQSASVVQMFYQWNEAIGLPAFMKYKSHELSLDDCQAISARRTLQRLIQALLRERLLPVSALNALPNGDRTLRLSADTQLICKNLVPNKMDSWFLNGSVLLQCGGTCTSVILPSQLLELLRPLLDVKVNTDVLARVSEEIDNSFINDTLCVAFHRSWSTHLTDTYGKGHEGSFLAGMRYDATLNISLLLEQWGTTGHPWHPNYKTKLGLSTSQVLALSPEFEASFNVALCALHKDFIHIESLSTSPDFCELFAQWFPGRLHELNNLLRDQCLEPSDYIPIPVHPWQARETLPSLFADEIRDRVLVMTPISAFTAHPTMSFRTVLPEADALAPMVKLPVGVRLTSVQRTVSPRSACMGPRVSALLLDILKREPEIKRTLAIVPECVGLHFESHRPMDDRARHLAVLFRNNPSQRLAHGEIAIPVGSLFAEDQNNQPLLRQWVLLSEGADTSQAASEFLDRYLYAALPGLLAMYVLYGVAFEAHQQNSFMVMGSNGKPSHLLLRDFGDIRIHRETLHLRGLDLVLKDPTMTLYDDCIFVRDKLLHTAFMCHFGELILLISRTWAIDESMLWQTLSDHVNCRFDDLRERAEPRRWRNEREALLVSDWPAKSLLRMRLLDSPTDIVGRMKNPLSAPLHAG